MTLRLADDEQRALRDRADVEGASMHDVVRRAVREYVARHGHREHVVAAAELIIESHGDALDRLG